MYWCNVHFKPPKLFTAAIRSIKSMSKDMYCSTYCMALSVNSDGICLIQCQYMESSIPQRELTSPSRETSGCSVWMKVNVKSVSVCLINCFCAETFNKLPACRQIIDLFAKSIIMGRATVYFYIEKAQIFCDRDDSFTTYFIFPNNNCFGY